MLQYTVLRSENKSFPMAYSRQAAWNKTPNSWVLEIIETLDAYGNTLRMSRKPGEIFLILFLCISVNRFEWEDCFPHSQIICHTPTQSNDKLFFPPVNLPLKGEPKHMQFLTIYQQVRLTTDKTSREKHQ